MNEHAVVFFLLHTFGDVSFVLCDINFTLTFKNAIAGLAGMAIPPSRSLEPLIKLASLHSITTTMVSRLTLNLRMYDPTASNELTFQTMSWGLQHIDQHTSNGPTFKEDSDVALSIVNDNH